ncbi:hypothetical protein GpartN1_g6258.t1 [Galdieria partita]|uniref:Uncharacterized protein n=1 Tax=Galdieria partita TaxID=83374 RepID=A0A9C7UT99_9RHOD|nr:hypothetical protein GpartN1_g6258.t1 [Galdieria partita]
MESVHPGDHNLALFQVSKEDETFPSHQLYTFQAPWLVYGLAWCNRVNNPYSLALSSFIESCNNKIILVQLDEKTEDFQQVVQVDHPYPASKVAFIPDYSGTRPQLLATCGDALRIWEWADNNLKGKALLSTNPESEYCAPLTSFDWCEINPAILCTSSVDTTCTVWDVETQQAKTQLIAHDKEVYDVAFQTGTDKIFASAGADGSVRCFDLRNLETSTILYEIPDDSTPILRIGWNKKEPNYMAALVMDSSKFLLLDIRVPSLPVAEMEHKLTNPKRHKSVNAIQWAPHSSSHICSAGDDCYTLIWDVSAIPRPIEEPILSYQSDREVNNLQWSAADPDWVAIAAGSKMQILRV